MEYHGRVLELEHQELFHSKEYKLMSTLLRGEPYQLSHQSLEYTLRVEEITDGFSTEVTDFSLFGNYLGRLHVGDEVIIRAKNKGNRRIAKSIYNRTTSSMVSPGLQLPAWLVRLSYILLAIVIVAAIYGIVYLFTSGAIIKGIVALLGALLATLGPSIFVLIGIYLLIRSILPPRKK